MYIVKRKYFSKKQNKVIEKVYQYNKKYTYKSKTTKGKKGNKLVGENGRIYSWNVKKLKKAIEANENYSEDKKRALLADLDATIEQRIRENKKLTTNGFIGKHEEDNISRFFANAGWSAEEISQETGVDVDDLLNESNWNDDMFESNGKKLKFTFTYTGSFWEEV